MSRICRNEYAAEDLSDMCCVVFAALCSSVLGATLPAEAATDETATTSSGGVVAKFDDGTINLAEGWGDARACVSDSGGTRCYRSEREMDISEAASRSAASAPANCSTALRLYSQIGFGGSVLQLGQRGVNFDLANYGFDNTTSSYRVGACSSKFFDGGSSSTQYPGSTTAGASASSMSSGWDNRVSTVFIA